MDQWEMESSALSWEEENLVLDRSYAYEERLRETLRRRLVKLANYGTQVKHRVWGEGITVMRPSGYPFKGKGGGFIYVLFPVLGDTRCCYEFNLEIL